MAATAPATAPATASADASIDVSVVIVNMNGRALLDTCLASIYRHTCGIIFEIMVVWTRIVANDVRRCGVRAWTVPVDLSQPSQTELLTVPKFFLKLNSCSSRY